MQSSTGKYSNRMNDYIVLCTQLQGFSVWDESYLFIAQLDRSTQRVIYAHITPTLHRIENWIIFRL